MVSSTTSAALEELVEDWYWEEQQPAKLSVEDARKLLYQRCIDAGWGKAKATMYLNRHLPLKLVP
jgi:hypothetical protein